MLLNDGRILEQARKSQRPRDVIADKQPSETIDCEHNQQQQQEQFKSNERSIQPSGEAQTDRANISVRQTGELKAYSYYFSSIGWIPSLMFASLVFVFGASVQMTQFLISNWTAAISDHGNSVNPFYVGLYALLSGAAMIGILGGAYSYLLVIVPLSAEGLHARLLGTVLNAPLSFFVNTDTGVTTNRFSQDMNVVDNELPFAMVDLVINVVIALVGTALICSSAGYFAVVIPFVVAIMWRKSTL